MVGTNLGKCEWVVRGKTKMAWFQDEPNSGWQLIYTSWVRIIHPWVKFFVQMVGTNLASQCGMRFWVRITELQMVESIDVLNSSWQNSRWLPSSSWVRMTWVWVRWTLVWFRVRVEWEHFWSAIWEMITRCLNPWCHVSEYQQWQNSRWLPIIKLSQNEVSEVYFVQNGWIQVGRFQHGCHLQVESEWMS